MIGVIVHWGLYWGPVTHGKFHVLAAASMRRAHQICESRSTPYLLRLSSQAAYGQRSKSKAPESRQCARVAALCKRRLPNGQVTLTPCCYQIRLQVIVRSRVIRFSSICYWFLSYRLAKAQNGTLQGRLLYKAGPEPSTEA